MRAYVPYTEALTPIQAAHIRLSESRAMADAYAECMLRRKATWEAAPNADAWADYQAALHQFRAAKDTERVADANLTETLKGHARERAAA